jgi:uncharacterized protein (TIGR02246 family)
VEPVDVVRRHLVAVQRRDPEAMAADYADDAVLVRPGERHEGHDAIARYFAHVGPRLGSGDVFFGQPVVQIDGSITVRWWIAGGVNDGIGGIDTFVVAAGRIVTQHVHLDGADF